MARSRRGWGLLRFLESPGLESMESRSVSPAKGCLSPVSTGCKVFSHQLQHPHQPTTAHAQLPEKVL